MSEQQTQSFTQEQVNELITQEKAKWESEVLKPIQDELEQVKAKLPKEPTEEEKAIQAKQQELFQKEVQLTLKEHGLDDFSEFFVVNSIEELKEKIEKFQKILNERKIKSSFKPENHRQTDQYSKYVLKPMIKSPI